MGIPLGFGKIQWFLSCKLCVKVCCTLLLVCAVLHRYWIDFSSHWSYVEPKRYIFRFAIWIMLILRDEKAVEPNVAHGRRLRSTSWPDTLMVTLDCPQSLRRVRKCWWDLSTRRCCRTLSSTCPTALKSSMNADPRQTPLSWLLSVVYWIDAIWSWSGP